MSKDKISDYSATANSNTDIAGINIDEGCAPSGINNAIRTLMKQLKDWQSGSQDVYITPAGTVSAPAVTTTGDTNTGVYFPAADKIALATGGTQAVIVDSSQNVGIGTSSPGVKLDISGSNGSFIRYTSAAGISSVLGDNGGTLGQTGTTTNHPFIFLTNATERARIDSSGNLLVGTTDSPATLLTDGYAGVAISASNWLVASRFNNPAAYFKRENSNGEAVFFLRDATTVGSISVTTTATSFNTSSDYRLKNTVAPMVGALEKVALLKPCTYKWNADDSDGEGFIAHELAEVCPHAVTGEKDATRIEQYELSPAIPATFDDEGNELTPAVEAVMGEREVPAYQGIDVSFLVATLTAAIQELKAVVDAQAARIEALEAK